MASIMKSLLRSWSKIPKLRKRRYSMLHNINSLKQPKSQTSFHRFQIQCRRRSYKATVPHQEYSTRPRRATVASCFDHSKPTLNRKQMTVTGVKEEQVMARHLYRYEIQCGRVKSLQLTWASTQVRKSRRSLLQLHQVRCCRLNSLPQKSKRKSQ